MQSLTQQDEAKDAVKADKPRLTPSFSKFVWMSFFFFLIFVTLASVLVGSNSESSIQVLKSCHPTVGSIGSRHLDLCNETQVLLTVSETSTPLCAREIDPCFQDLEPLNVSVTGCYPVVLRNQTWATRYPNLTRFTCWVDSSSLVFATPPSRLDLSQGVGAALDANRIAGLVLFALLGILMGMFLTILCMAYIITRLGASLKSRSFKTLHRLKLAEAVNLQQGESLLPDDEPDSPLSDPPKPMKMPSKSNGKSTSSSSVSSAAKKPNVRFTVDEEQDRDSDGDMEERKMEVKEEISGDRSVDPIGGVQSVLIQAPPPLPHLPPPNSSET